MRSNEELDAAINEAADVERIRALVKNSLEARGIISRQPGNDFEAQLLRLPEPEPTSAPTMPVSSAPPTCIRVIYPHGDDRYEVYGASEQELDAKERLIRSLYGGQR